MPVERPDQPESTTLVLTNELLLAAVRRAALHGGARDTGAQGVARTGAPLWSVVAHLGLSRRHGPGRTLRGRLETLVRRGWLARGVQRGTARWALTRAGALTLARACSASPLELPESPQHRAWRTARDLATEEFVRFHGALRAQLEHAAGMLDAEPPPSSDAWFELAERLQSSARLCGSARHCMYEWSEPSDERADVDDLREPTDRLLPEPQRARLRARRRGRRNVVLWHTP